MSAKDSTELIPAVAYLRKSTKGVRKASKKHQRHKQEKSLAQQKAEILKMARGRFAILKWFEDEGVSGWKRGAGRPDFANMLREVKELGARAVLCDALDRFSRATREDVDDDAKALVRAGVRQIVTNDQGEFPLGTRDIGAVLRFTVAVWAAHEYSRNLARRIALARRDAAEEGRRTGGRDAYGLADDGEGGYRPGDPAQAEVVRWAFRQFADEGRSLCWLAGDLNRRGVPGPRGGKWYTKTVNQLLRRRCYRGDFEYGKAPVGHFYRLDAEGEVVEREEVSGKGKVFRKEGAHKPLVDPALWDRAQGRLATLKNRARRKRLAYALSGVLKCDHCNSTLYGARSGRLVVYRCNGNNNLGTGTCAFRQVREDEVLPLVARLLGEEIDNVLTLLSQPPDEAGTPRQRAQARAEAAKADRAALALRIDNAMRARIESDDPRTRKDYDRLITEWRDRLDRLDAELAPDPEPAEDLHEVGRQALLDLAKWFDGIQGEVPASVLDLANDLARQKVISGGGNEGTVPVPFAGKLPPEVELFRRARDGDGRLVEPQAVCADPRKVNNALHRVGCEVRLRWGPAPPGSPRKTVVTRGRFRLGQREGELELDLDGVLAPSDCRRPSGRTRWSGSPCRAARRRRICPRPRTTACAARRAPRSA
jgi:DNA invertase Pin-like site-specific DNA recombinase